MYQATRKNKNNQSMEITKQVKQKQTIFPILTQEEIFRSLISTDHHTLRFIFPKGLDILVAARTQILALAEVTVVKT